MQSCCYCYADREQTCERSLYSYVPKYVEHVLKNVQNMIINIVKNVQRLVLSVQMPVKKWLDNDE